MTIQGQTGMSEYPLYSEVIYLFIVFMNVKKRIQSFIAVNFFLSELYKFSIMRVNFIYKVEKTRKLSSEEKNLPNELSP